MHALLDTLRDLADRVDAAGACDGWTSMPDDDLADALALVGRMQRRVEAAAIEVVGEAASRSTHAERDARLTTRFGCHDVAEFVQRAMLVGPQTAARMQRAARCVRGVRSPTTGELLPPLLPATHAALRAGAVGLDGVLAIAAPLAAAERRLSREAMLVADRALAAEARGDGPEAAPAACPDLLRVQALAWAGALDQDGAEPADRDAAHRRGVTIGAARDGVVPVRGMLMPEVAAQLQRIFDAALSPRVDGAVDVRFADSEPDPDERPPVDDRRRPQRQHDALATALHAAAASGELPTIGGAAPTLVVSIREEDLHSGRGYAHAEGSDQPLSPASARHLACAGAVQRVFNRYQRRGIALRDGGCIIPGCGVPAGWCEIHHVTDHARGGPTHTDNGVLLCWFHHRFLDRSGWSIRMNRGVPEVRAPQWCDATRRWRAVTRSRTRMVDRVLRT